jgi:outer membrane protein assembly factor BamB
MTLSWAFRLFAATFTLGLAAATAEAAPLVSVSPGNNHPSSSTNVSGTGFGASEIVDLYFDTTDEELAVTTASGAFSNVPIPVPASALPGTHWITAGGRHSGLGAQRPFAVNTNWSQFNFGIGHKGLNPYENVIATWNAPAMDAAWTAETNSENSSSPVVVGNVVYVGSCNGKIYAFNAITGSPISGWPVLTNATACVNGTVVANNVLYAGSADGKLYAFKTNGASLAGWPAATAGQIESAPLVLNGVVYAGSTDHKLYAFNATTGALLPGWPVVTGNVIFGSPTAANGVIYAGSFDHMLYAFNAKTAAAEPYFPVATGGQIEDSAAVANGVVYVGSDKLYAFNVHTGAAEPGWPATVTTGVVTAPAVANGIVYVADESGDLDAFYASSGIAVSGWPVRAPNDFLQGSPAVANGVVFIAGQSHVYAFDALHGNPLWRTSTPLSSYIWPAVTNGMVYQAYQNGSMTAYALNAGNNQVYHRNPRPPTISSLHPNFSLSPWKRAMKVSADEQ